MPHANGEPLPDELAAIALWFLRHADKNNRPVDALVGIGHALLAICREMQAARMAGVTR